MGRVSFERTFACANGFLYDIAALKTSAYAAPALQRAKGAGVCGTAGTVRH
jgi:hypothetical protein